MSTSDPTTVVVEDQLPTLDVRSEEFLAAPHEVLQRVRRDGPIARSHRGIEVLSFDLCAAIFSDDRFATLPVEHFRTMGAPEVLVSFVEHGLLLNTDRERHDRVRRVLLRAFSIRQVDDQREVMREVAVRLVARLLDAAGGDLVADFTEHYPMEVLCRLLGVPPADIPIFHRAAIDLHLMGAVPLAPGFPRLEEALSVLWKFILGLVEQRKADPRDDFISALIDAQVQEVRLTDEEVVWNLVNLLFAGQDTTRYQLASAVRVFASQPGVWDRLGGDPATIPAALDEAMRLRPVSQFVVRRATAATEAGGFRFPVGRRIILNLLAASRDPAVFPRPATFDPERDPTYRLPFGWGLHYCLGHALARAEMCEALEVMTREMASPEVGVGRDASAAAMIGGPESLPISCTRRGERPSTGVTVADLSDQRVEEQWERPDHDQMVRRTARHVAAMKSSDSDEVWRVSGMEHVVLTTIGRRSGAEHKVALAIWREPDGTAVVAGSSNGEDRHPAWFLNLRDRAEPEILCRTQGSQFWSEPEILDGEEYDRVWGLLVDDRPFFADYAGQIDRKIPLVRLPETRPVS